MVSRTSDFRPSTKTFSFAEELVISKSRISPKSTPIALSISWCQ
uniref:Uncharacterized protein At2g11260 n=1 Tax=Arabidopsis thaliana TaxID=3702 RepID=Q9ZQL9_ARATH|nr:unknown protein [Arabidopsis thaliana]AAK73260.1 Unknown protein [Arabidopsis thaliana]